MRLIDADELMKHSDWYDLATGKSIHGVQNFEIASMQTIDAVPVVRCKDCKYHEDEKIGMVYCSNAIDGWIGEYWFCANGERKDGMK